MSRTQALRAGATGIFLAAGLAFACSPVLALDPSRSINQYVHDVWEIEDGLPQNSVHDVVQDTDGYLWLATLEGLVRFDGVQFTVFNRANTDAITSNEMRSFHLDDRGVLWIGSYGGGLLRLDEQGITALGREDGLADPRVWEIDGAGAGGIWLGTHGGLYHYDRGTFRRYDTTDGLAGDDVRCVHVDDDGSVWAGTMNGLSLFDGRKFRTYTTREGLAHNKVKSIFRDSAGRLWVGTHAGLSRLSGDSFQSYSTRDGLVHESVVAIFEDRSGALWLGTDGGINRFHDGRFTTLPAEHDLAKHIVRSFYEDLEGSLWIGTESGGLNRLQQGKLVAYGRDAGLTVDLIWSILETRDGRLMMGSTDGLFEYRDGAFARHRRAGASNNWFSTVHEGKDGTLWVGTRGDGLFVFRDGRFRSPRGREHLAQDYIHALHEDRDGGLWIGTRDGLRRLKDGSVTFYSTRDGLAGNVVRCIEADGAGGLWIGTGTGLSHLTNGTFRNYTKKDGLSSEAVFSILADADGTLWLGTYGGGLNRFRDGVFDPITTKEGLYDDVVYVILEDERNTLWMSGNKGIFRVRKSDVDDFIRSRVLTVPCTSFGVADGMKSRECNGGLQPAGTRARDGTLWFPTIRGVVAVRPAAMRSNAQVPPVHIVRLVVDGAEQPRRKSIELRAGDDSIELHYTALSYRVPKRVRFRYRLEGYDSAWVDAGTRRVAYYTNLPPGTYTFRVKACNDDGLWNETGASLSLRKRPQFHQTWWFYAAVIGLASLALFTLYRLRVKHLERRERELEALVAQRTKELKEASLRDSLTGLRNRRFISEIVAPDASVFAERKRHLLEHGGPPPAHPMESCLGVFMIDIDRFKSINDAMGHEAGDRVLEQFSAVLRREVRKDDVVVRWGGEEFLVVLRHAAEEFVTAFADRLRDAVARTEFVASRSPRRTVRRSCSIGYVSFPFYRDAPELVSLGQAIMIADLGLYHSKRNGRNLAVGIEPGDKIPRNGDLLRTLTSLEFGTQNEYLRIREAKTPRRVWVTA